MDLTPKKQVKDKDIFKYMDEKTGVEVFEIPQDAPIEKYIDACDFVNMMPMLKWDNGQFLASVDFTVSSPHPGAWFFLTREEYKSGGDRYRNAWKKKHKELVDKSLADPQIREQISKQVDAARKAKTGSSLLLPKDFKGAMANDAGMMVPTGEGKID